MTAECGRGKLTDMVLLKCHPECIVQSRVLCTEQAEIHK